MAGDTRPARQANDQPTAIPQSVGNKICFYLIKLHGNLQQSSDYFAEHQCNDEQNGLNAAKCAENLQMLYLHLMGLVQSTCSQIGDLLLVVSSADFRLERGLFVQENQSLRPRGAVDLNDTKHDEH